MASRGHRDQNQRCHIPENCDPPGMAPWLAPGVCKGQPPVSQPVGPVINSL